MYGYIVEKNKFPAVFVLQYKFVLTKVTRRAPTSGARKNVLSETREISPDYSGVRVALTLVCFLCAMFYRLFFFFFFFFFNIIVVRFFFFWPFHCRSFVNLMFLIGLTVSSNFVFLPLKYRQHI